MSKKTDIDWNQITNKEVMTLDGVEIGKVDGLEDTEIVVKDGIIDPKFYRIPRQVLEYAGDKVIVNLSEREVKSKYERASSGYYQQNNSTGGGGRTSNTVA